MTAAQRKIHTLGTVAVATDIVVDRLRSRASKIDGDGIAYVSRDELTSIADRLDELNGYAKELHTKLLDERPAEATR
jgi:hypothetical protein